MRTKAQALKQGQEIISGYQKAIELLALVPDFKGANFSISEKTVHVDLPFDWDTYKKYRKLMGKSWKKADSGWTTSQHETDGGFVSYHRNFLPVTDPHDYYYMAEAYLSVSLETYRAGSTCQLKQVGEKVLPVWEVTCD